MNIYFEHSGLDGMCRKIERIFQKIIIRHRWVEYMSQQCKEELQGCINTLVLRFVGKVKVLVNFTLSRSKM